MKLILIFAVLLAGCNPTTKPALFGLHVYTDEDTGCQYLSGSSGLSPRIAADGKTHMGCKAINN